MSQARSKGSARATAVRVAIYVFLGLVCVAQILPFYLKLVSSFHPTSFIPRYDRIYLLPQGFSLNNYIEAWRRANLLRGLMNSLIHSVGLVVLTLIIAFVFGYVLGKIKFRGNRVVFILILSTLMVPGEVLMIPNFLLVQRLGWYDTLAAIILPGLVNAFGIFLFRNFMNTIPDSVLESAELDGAGEIVKIFRIVMPMSVPVIITFIILTFTATWNEYVWPMTVLQNPINHTLQLRMYKFYPQFSANPYADGYIQSAGVILISIPIIALFLTNQRYFLQSVNVSGIK